MFILARYYNNIFFIL